MGPHSSSMTHWETPAAPEALRIRKRRPFQRDGWKAHQGKPIRLENDLEMLVFHGVSISKSQISQRKLLSSECFGPGNPRTFQMIQGLYDYEPALFVSGCPRQSSGRVIVIVRRAVNLKEIPRSTTALSSPCILMCMHYIHYFFYIHTCIVIVNAS